MNNIKNLLIPGQTYCLLGSSGVGKTTLLNNLLGKDQLATQAVRERDSKGRHTTTRRHLLILENGAMIIDTPGMRELGNFGVETGIDETYDEITELAFQCRFNDCTHTNEKGCAILHAITEGLLPIERYENYQKLKKESAHYGMSYVEKRKRDKKFGKLYKEIMKNKKKNDTVVPNKIFELTPSVRRFFQRLSLMYLADKGHGLPVSHLPPGRLVSTGPYKYSRHPIYISYILAWAGFACIAGSF